MKFLENIRARSDVEKRSFAFIVSLTITVVIIIIWSVTIFSRLLAPAPENTANTLTPVDNLGQQFKEIFKESAIPNENNFINGN